MAGPAAPGIRGNDQYAEMILGSSEIIDSITAQTTSQEFDALRARFPQYQLADGGRVRCTALHKAVMLNNIPLARHILAVGGRRLVNLGMDFGFTPLLMAAGHGPHISEILIDAGADVNLTADSRKLNPDQVGRDTSLYVAATNGNTELVRLLLRRGAIVGRPETWQGNVLMTLKRAAAYRSLKQLSAEAVLRGRINYLAEAFLPAELKEYIAKAAVSNLHRS